MTGMIEVPVQAAEPAASGHVRVGTAIPARTATAAMRFTTITFVIDNCTRCAITRVVRAIDLTSRIQPHYPDYQDYTVGKLTGNRYRAKVPTAATRGLSFEIDASWRGVGGYLGYNSNIALRYAGYKVGARVSAAKAKRAKRAIACWAGTTRTSYTIHVSARRVRTRSEAGGNTIINDLQAWSTWGLRTVGPSGPRLPGNQEAWYC
ncbi:MAG: hypothetical protein U0S36_02505 [Candidatus Nanopelagicales bacterium]